MACDAIVELEGASQMEVTKVRSGVRRLQAGGRRGAERERASSVLPREAFLGLRLIDHEQRGSRTRLHTVAATGVSRRDVRSCRSAYRVRVPRQRCVGVGRSQRHPGVTQESGVVTRTGPCSPGGGEGGRRLEAGERRRALRKIRRSRDRLRSRLLPWRPPRPPSSQTRV